MQSQEFRRALLLSKWHKKIQKPNQSTENTTCADSLTRARSCQPCLPTRIAGLCVLSSGCVPSSPSAKPEGKTKQINTQWRIGCIRVHQCLSCQNWDNLPARWQWLLYLYWIWRLQTSYINYITLIAIECHHIQMKKRTVKCRHGLIRPRQAHRGKHSTPLAFSMLSPGCGSCIFTNRDIPWYPLPQRLDSVWMWWQVTSWKNIKPSICATSKATALPLEFEHWRYERPVPCCFSHLVKWCDAMMRKHWKMGKAQLPSRPFRHVPSACSGIWLHRLRHEHDGTGTVQVSSASYVLQMQTSRCCKFRVKCCNMLQLQCLWGNGWMMLDVSNAELLFLSMFVSPTLLPSDETNLTACHRSCEPLRCTSCFLSYIENVEKMCQDRASSSLAVNLGSSHSRQPPALNRLHRRCPLPRELRSCQEIFASIVEIVASCMLLYVAGFLFSNLLLFHKNQIFGQSSWTFGSHTRRFHPLKKNQKIKIEWNKVEQQQQQQVDL